MLYVEGASSVRKSQDEIVLKISVSTIERNLQFFNCHQFVMFSSRHQLTESSVQWFDPIKIYVGRAVEIFRLGASTPLKTGTST